MTTEKNLAMVLGNEKVMDYMNVDELMEEIYKLLEEERESFVSDLEPDEKEYILSMWDDDQLEMEAEMLAQNNNHNMKKYLHMEDHNIPGNFMDVELNYKTDYDCGYKEFQDMIARLDAGDDTAKSKEDREYLRNWFWEAFGSFGIKYNFSSTLNTYLCDYEYERERNAERECKDNVA